MTADPLPEKYDWTFRRVMWATLVVVLIALGFWLIYRFIQVFFILFIVIVLGTVLRRAVAWLHQRGFSRTVGLVLIFLTLLALVIGFVLLLFPLILDQGTTITAAMPDYYQALREWMINSPNPLLVRLGEFTPAALSSFIPHTDQTAGPGMVTSAGQLLGYYIRTLIKLLFFALVVVVLTFYSALDGPRIIKSFLLVASLEKRESLNELILAMETKVGLYVVGQTILCLVIGVMALIAYLLIGLPNALVLALVAGVLEAVPMVGPLLGAVPAALVAFSIGPDKLVWVVVATVVIQQLENSLLVPRVMKETVGVNPFVSLLSFFAFSTLFGIGGALMAIPMAAIIQLLLGQFVFHSGIVETEVPIGRNYASRLRYEARDLAQDLRKQARLKKGGSEQEIKQIDQMLDEIETITNDLDALLAQAPPSPEMQ
ncbi:MAG TPA: AI-2E family transporter [Anaerolineales bacterium]|jgi:predicted PurR-regulated permease PerM